MLYDDLVQPGSYICHHGVKGQKWGVRHDRQKIGRKTSNNIEDLTPKLNRILKSNLITEEDFYK